MGKFALPSIQNSFIEPLNRNCYEDPIMNLSVRSLCYCLIGLVACLSVSCGKREPDPVAVMLQSAEGIVREPQNWQKNTGLVVDFQKAAQKAHLSEDDVVKSFQSAATKLVTFGAGWTQVASTHQIEEYRRLSLEALAQIHKTSTLGANAKADATADFGESSKKLLELISHSLDGSESKQFEKTWTNALDALKALHDKFEIGAAEKK